MPYGLKDSDIQSITSILKAHPAIEKAVLYGSRAKGNFKKFSDIDLTLEGKELQLSEMLDVANEIDDLLLPYETDLSIKSMIRNEALLEHIERVGVTIYDASNNNSTQQ